VADQIVDIVTGLVPVSGSSAAEKEVEAAGRIAGTAAAGKAGGDAGASIAKLLLELTEAVGKLPGVGSLRKIITGGAAAAPKVAENAADSASDDTNADTALDDVSA
jgi:hypothetical protein